METKKILVIDDEETLCEILQYNLENEGYDVDIAYSAEQALKLQLECYSLIILDIMLEEISGIKLARMLKSNVKTADIHIIFCSARDSDDDMVMGLEIGADDYIVKPYSVRNVLARVKSVLRRNHIQSEVLPTIAKPNLMQVNGLKLDLEFKRCLINENEVKMTRKEFELLVFLITHRGKICSREEILSKVWKDEVVVLDRTIDVNIRRLRSKIGTYGENIVTRCGYGYGFKE
jgi:two-component system phosphate regulon response regulator PhoB